MASRGVDEGFLLFSASTVEYVRVSFYHMPIVLTDATTLDFPRSSVMVGHVVGKVANLFR